MAYNLNGVNMYTAFGFVASKDCYKGFLQIREAKEPYSYDWPEENGIEYDLDSAIAYKDRELRLSGYIEASSLADYNTKINALVAALYPDGRVFDIQSTLAGVTITVMTTKKPVIEALTKTDASKFISEINIELKEVQGVAALYAVPGYFPPGYVI